MHEVVCCTTGANRISAYADFAVEPVPGDATITHWSVHVTEGAAPSWVDATICTSKVIASPPYPLVDSNCRGVPHPGGFRSKSASLAHSDTLNEAYGANPFTLTCTASPERRSSAGATVTEGAMPAMLGQART